MGFSKDAFKNANQGGGYQAVPNGVYNFEVQDCDLTTNEATGSENFKLNLQVFDHDEHDGEWVFIQQNIVKKNGEVNEIGLQQMNTWLNRLSDGKFDPDDFEEDENGEITNTDEVLVKFIGTKFKGMHKSTSKDGYTNSTVNFKALLYNNYTNGEAKSKVTDTDINDDELDTEEPVTAPNAETKPKELPSEKDAKIGMEVIFLNKNNQEETGTIQSFVEGPSGEGMVMVKPMTGPPLAILQSNVWALPDEEEDYEEELPFVKGSKVKAVFRGESYEGTIHEVNESEGTCKVKFLDPAVGKLKLRPQKISDCVVIS